MKKAVFLDRDGILIEDRGYLYKKEDIKPITGILNVLERLRKNNYLLLVVSNQAVIGRGLADECEIREINKQINKNLKNLIKKFYVCPHHPDADLINYRKSCNFRKPNPGLILEASKDFDIDLKDSWMIGDRISDIVAGKKAGCKTILFENSKSYKKIKSGEDYPEAEPDFIIKNIIELNELIK